ncbi:MAG: hypothetical protein CMJ25_03685 [Phycisphaerae bacterium]|nr:hypothetical protein [Phycisphaerae bacterium]
MQRSKSGKHKETHTSKNGTHTTKSSAKSNQGGANSAQQIVNIHLGEVVKARQEKTPSQDDMEIDDDDVATNPIDSKPSRKRKMLKTPPFKPTDDDDDDSQQQPRSKRKKADKQSGKGGFKKDDDDDDNGDGRGKKLNRFRQAVDAYQSAIESVPLANLPARLADIPDGLLTPSTPSEVAETIQWLDNATRELNQLQRFTFQQNRNFSPSGAAFDNRSTFSFVPQDTRFEIMKLIEQRKENEKLIAELRKKASDAGNNASTDTSNNTDNASNNASNNTDNSSNNTSNNTNTTPPPPGNNTNTTPPPPGNSQPSQETPPTNQTETPPEDGGPLHSDHLDTPPSSVDPPANQTEQPSGQTTPPSAGNEDPSAPGLDEVVTGTTTNPNVVQSYQDTGERQFIIDILRTLPGITIKDNQAVGPRPFLATQYLRDFDKTQKMDLITKHPTWFTESFKQSVKAQKNKSESQRDQGLAASSRLKRSSTLQMFNFFEGLLVALTKFAKNNPPPSNTTTTHDGNTSASLGNEDEQPSQLGEGNQNEFEESSQKDKDQQEIERNLKMSQQNLTDNIQALGSMMLEQAFSDDAEERERLLSQINDLMNTEVKSNEARARTNMTEALNFGVNPSLVTQVQSLLDSLQEERDRLAHSTQTDTPTSTSNPSMRRPELGPLAPQGPTEITELGSGNDPIPSLFHNLFGWH